MVTFPPETASGPEFPGDGLAERNQRRAGEAWLSGPVDEHRGRDRRQGRAERDRLDPRARDGELDRIRSGRGMLESRMAWRSDPGPLSAVVVTTKRPSVIGQPAPATTGRHRGWASTLSVVLPWNPGAGVKVRPSRAALSAERGP